MIKLKPFLYSLFSHLFVFLIFLVFCRLTSEVPAKYIEIDLSLANLAQIQTESLENNHGLSSKKEGNPINRFEKKDISKDEKENLSKETIVKNSIVENKETDKFREVINKFVENRVVENTYARVENTNITGNRIENVNSSGEGSKGIYKTSEGEGGSKGGQNIAMIGKGFGGAVGGNKKEVGGSGDLDKEREKFLLEKLYVISKIVQKNINYPYIARRMGWEGKVVISFIFKKDGQIDFLIVEKSSGYEVLDKNAIDTIKRVSKYFPLPPVDVKIKLPITYQLQ